MTYQHVQWAFWSICAVLLCLTVWLFVQNRDSETAGTNLASAALIGAFGVLVTLLFSLKPESRDAIVPVEYVFDNGSKAPFTCDFFPPVSDYTDPGRDTGSARFIVLPQVQRATPDLVADPNEDAGIRLYRVRPGTTISRSAIVAMFPDCPSLPSDFLDRLDLPPNTHLVPLTDPEQRGFVLSNPFVRVSVSVRPQSHRRGVGMLASLCRLEGDTTNTSIDRRAQGKSYSKRPFVKPGAKRVTAHSNQLEQMASSDRALPYSWVFGG